jgi:hypothetical protein
MHVDEIEGTSAEPPSRASGRARPEGEPGDRSVVRNRNGSTDRLDALVTAIDRPAARGKDTDLVTPRP